MQRVRFHFDVVSPYAWLAFAALPQALEGISHVVEYRPLLFAGLLKHWGQKAPVDVAPKREWIFRQCAWLAAGQGVAFSPPVPHPFNPLALLRLTLACADAGDTPNRQVVEAAMRHVWDRGGADPNEPAALQALQQRLAPRRTPTGDDVKAELQALTAQAVADGVFGVPTFRTDDGALFWGLDSLPMLRDHLLTNPAPA